MIVRYTYSKPTTVFANDPKRVYSDTLQVTSEEEGWKHLEKISGSYPGPIEKINANILDNENGGK